MTNNKFEAKKEKKVEDENLTEIGKKRVGSSLETCPYESVK
jgi:hypothetical protein